MTPNSVLIELLERVSAGQNAAVFVADYELEKWPINAVAAMKEQKLILRTRPTTSAICPGCERNCTMPVETLTGEATSFIICDKRSDINRVAVSNKKLTQWRCSANSVCDFVAGCLGLRRTAKATRQLNNGMLREIGIVIGKKHRQMLCLQVDGALFLCVGNGKVPLTELIHYQDNAYSFDGDTIRQLADTTTTADDRYTPSIIKRNSRKLDTKNAYEIWQKEYRKLKRKHPNRSAVWHSQKIAKMDIAQGRSSETIRKQMK